MWFFYKNQQNVGPIEEADIVALIRSNSLSEDTPVWQEGMGSWSPLKTTSLRQYLTNGSGAIAPQSAIPSPPPMPPQWGQNLNTVVKDRDLTATTVFTAVSIGIYWIVFLVPAYTRDIEAITRRPRLGFAAACILGILTLGIVTAVLACIYAFELEKKGAESALGKRQASLGLQVTLLTVAMFIIAFFSGGIAFFISVGINAYIAYAMQKEINLHAASEITRQD